MKSKLILFCIVVSAIILTLSKVNINVYEGLPIKATYNALTEPVKKQVTCLADNIYHEAAFEPEKGQKAVAFVTLNRVKSGNYAEDICGVVKQKTNGTCQFSWFCEHGLTITNRSVYNQIREMATYMVVNYDKLEDVTDGATYYHADYVNPHWKLQRVSQIGRHIFYKRKGDEIDRNREFY